MPDDSFDMSVFMGAFREESQELIATVTEGLLQLEQTPDDPDRMREIARAVHTLKGNARLMGLDRINTLAHRLENLLVSVRDGELAFTPTVADLVLEGLDLVSAAVGNVCETGEEGIETEAICDRIDQVAQGASARSASSKPSVEPASATAEEQPSVGPAKPSDAESPKARSPRAAKKQADKKPVVETPAEPSSAAPQKKASRKRSPRKKAKAAPSVTPVPTAASTTAVKPEKTTASEPRPTSPAETIRVDTGKLDGLANVAGEMVLNLIKFEAKADWVRRIVGAAKQHVRAWQQLRDELAASAGSTPAEREQLINRCDNTGAALLDELERLSQQFNEDVMRIDTTTRMIEEDVLSIRMHPVSTLFNTFPRSVRDMARQLGKPVELVIEGGETELDRKILETIRDPLLHLVRNAVGHGIESPEERERAGKLLQGTVRLSAWQQGDQVCIQVADDGRGINPEEIRETAIAKGLIDRTAAETLSRDDCLRFIFEPGFSTAAAIDDISGRGVGMDVVKVSVEEMHGEVRIESELGSGTAIILVLPLTLAISRAILVRTENRKFAIPTASIEMTVKVTPEEIKSIEGREVIIVRNATIPVLPLSRILGMDRSSSRANSQSLYVLVVSHSQQQVGLAVDELIGEQEIVVKPLGAPLKKVKNIAGAATLGSGEVVVVLSVPDIVAAARGAVRKAVVRQDTTAPAAARKKVLVVEDSLTARELERTLFEAAGYDVQTAFDGVDGLEKLAETPVDLIVSDIQMPRMDGFAMIRRVKSDDRYRNIPVVIVTTRTDEADRKRGLELGADAYLVKSSLNRDALLECTRRLIG